MKWANQTPIWCDTITLIINVGFYFENSARKSCVFILGQLTLSWINGAAGEAAGEEDEDQRDCTVKLFDLSDWATALVGLYLVFILSSSIFSLPSSSVQS